MMIRSLVVLAAAVGLMAAGCDVPVSVHPLTDEKTSAIDPQLNGVWEQILPADPERGANVAPPRWHIGRVAGKENVHELVVLEMDGDEHLQVRRIPLLATTIGERSYLSLLMNPDEPKEKHVFAIVLYEYDGEHKLQMLPMNKDIVAPAIEREELKGVVRKSPPDPNAPPAEQVKPKYKEIRITAEPAELKAWLAKQGKGAFTPASLLTMRKIEVQN